jgi:hypothetical protein
MINLLKIFFPNTIQDQSIGGGSTGTPSETKDSVFYPNTSPSNPITLPVVASQLVNISLNTQSRQILGNYVFGQLGAISIGKYVAGVSGNIKISPDGIVGTSKDDGLDSFTIDGTTGNATFKGTITALAGNIGGFTIASGYLWAGSGANTAGLSPTDYPFWAGDTYANRATAPFRVTPAGALIASNADISGSITSSDITVTDITVNVSSDGNIGGSPGSTGMEILYNNASRVLVSGGGITLRNTRAIYMGETTTTNFAKFGMDSDNITYFRTGPTTDELWIEDHDLAPYMKFRLDANDHHLADFNSYIVPFYDDGDPADATPVGAIYYDTNLNKFRANINGSWETLTTRTWVDANYVAK